MARGTAPRTEILDLLEEHALAIGGLVALHRVEDDFVWRLCRSLDVTRRRALRRLDERARTEESEAFTNQPRLRPHPAIEEFLERLERSRQGDHAADGDVDAGGPRG